MTDYTILFYTAAHFLEVGDQTIIDGDLVIIKEIDDNRDDPDEIMVTVNNLSDPASDEFELFADDEYAIWSM